MSMQSDSLVFAIFLIFTGAAILSTLALYTRQSLLVAYLFLGVLIGPWGLKLISNPKYVTQVGDVGIIFLLFLLGLHLHPQNLLHMLRKTVLVALISSLAFAAIGYVIGELFGFTQTESLIIGASVMFSSTIIGLKLLPTTVLHHQHTGEVMISILLMQDLIAILVLLALKAGQNGGVGIWHIGLMIAALPSLLIFAFLFERYILVKLIAKFDKVQEFIFLIAIAWCLSLTELANLLHLSEEIGAFIAGVALAASPIALFIAESLKPLRDFFLVIFFFSIGAGFNIHYLHFVIVPALILAILLLMVKPLLFRFLLTRVSESKRVAWEVGVRLGQASEFSILVAYLAVGTQLISVRASALIQAATIITFVISSYLVVMYYPTPMALTDKLRRN